MVLKRYPGNPVLKPLPEHQWESYGSFNGTIIKKDSKYILLYRALGNELRLYGQNLHVSVIGKSISDDGLNFKDRNMFISPDNDWEKFGCEDPRVTYIDGKYFIFYTAISNYPPNYSNIRVGVAISSDLEHINVKHLVTPFNAKAMAMFPEKIQGKYTVVLTVNTDNPPSYVAIARFEKIEMLWNTDFWNDWYKNINGHIIPLRRVNSDGVEVGAVPVKTSAGWVFIHSYIKHYFSQAVKKVFRIEAVLLDNNDPRKIIGRIEQPLLIPEAEYETKGNVKDIVFPEGALADGDTFRVYYGAADTSCAVAEAPLTDFMHSFETNQPATLKCDKFPHNPLLKPEPGHPWESKGVFNPAALELDNRIYIIYRALSKNNISSLGMAVSHDGLLIDERLAEPVYVPRMPFEKSADGKGPGGCEDPRITKIDNTLYMLYTAYDGVLPQLAMTSIKVDDFLNRNWDGWTPPKIISPQNLMDKDGVLFPEKINGKFVVFHRIEPNICIDYVDDLEFNTRLMTKSIITPHIKSWDAKKIGINTPPLKTKKGWIIFYHGISEIDGHYRLGAFLLDLADISKVTGWTPYPILEPETIFEREGLVPNVVFPCGYILKNGIVTLYYGAADRVVCGATIQLNDLLDYLLKSMSKKYLAFP